MFEAYEDASCYNLQQNNVHLIQQKFKRTMWLRLANIKVSCSFLKLWYFRRTHAL